MARRTLRILPYKGNRDYHYYLDGLKVNGKRKRLYFTSEAEAKEELRKWDKRDRKEGEDALAISQELRILATKCAKRLEPFEKSIWDATEFYIEHLERMRGSVPVTVLFTDYLETKQRAELSEKHLADIKQRLGRFVADFSNRAIETLTVRESKTGCMDSIFPLKRSITFEQSSEHSSNMQSKESWSKKIR